MGTKIERSSCVENGINPKAINDFLIKCDQKKLGLDSIMVLKGGKVVSEAYYHPFTCDTKHDLYSMSKTFTATAIGFAVDDGFLNLDDPISRFFPDYKFKGKNKLITVRHLITMTAEKFVPMTKFHKNRDRIEKFLKMPFIAKPGKKYFYISDNFYMLSVIIGIVTGKNTADYLYEKLFKPLGIEKPTWETDIRGNNSGGWGLYLSLEAQAKVWQCYANGGKWEGKQVIPSEWVNTATKYQLDTVKRGQIDVRMGYGLGFWRISLPNTYRAYGLHGQYGYVFEDKDTVLVINSGNPDDHVLAAEINEMYKTLWDTPDAEDEKKLIEYIGNLGEKDDLPSDYRNEEIESQISGVPMIPPKNTFFASMLHATVTAVMHKPIGHLFEIRITKDENGDLFFDWTESKFTNKIKLGFNNEYEVSPVHLADIDYNAYVKAAWTAPKVLTVYVRILESCHVRMLEFDFSKKNPVVRNTSYPDLPNLGAYYMDFMGYPLSPILRKLLFKVVAPAILLKVEPNFKLKMNRAAMVPMPKPEKTESVD